MIINYKSYFLKLVSKLLCLVIFLCPLSYFAQETLYRSTIGLGPNNFIRYSLFADLEIENSKNLFTIRADFNSGEGDSGSGAYDRYHSNFFDAAFLYGRTYRKDDWYLTSLSLGYYMYNHKYINARYPHQYPPPTTETFQGVGIAFQHKQLLITSDQFAIGLTVYGNLNLKRSVGGILISFVFGELR
jgi:hypothetical protein